MSSLSCNCKDSDIPLWLILIIFSIISIIFGRAFSRIAPDRPNVNIKQFVINNNFILAISAFIAIPSFLILFPKINTVAQAPSVPIIRWILEGSKLNQFEFTQGNNAVVLFTEPTCPNQSFSPQILSTQNRANKNVFWYDAGPVVLCPSPICSGKIGLCNLQNEHGSCGIEKDCDMLFSVRELKTNFSF